MCTAVNKQDFALSGLTKKQRLYYFSSMALSWMTLFLPLDTPHPFFGRERLHFTQTFTQYKTTFPHFPSSSSAPTELSCLLSVQTQREGEARGHHSPKKTTHSKPPTMASVALAFTDIQTSMGPKPLLSLIILSLKGAGSNSRLSRLKKNYKVSLTMSLNCTPRCQYMPYNFLMSSTY